MSEEALSQKSSALPRSGWWAIALLALATVALVSP